MSKEGYIYILIRADFIEKKEFIYKIGQTTRFPPHKRLWDYPYGSLFLNLFPTHSAVDFESAIKSELSKSPDLKCQKKIGIEYYSGSLQEMINIIVKLYPKYKYPNHNFIQRIDPINEDYLLKLNRIHYIVNFNFDYFSNIYKHTFISIFENNSQTESTDLIPSRDIYESYQKTRTWALKNYPDNYVIRCGLRPIKPSKPIFYSVPIQK